MLLHALLGAVSTRSNRTNCFPDHGPHFLCAAFSRRLAPLRHADVYSECRQGTNCDEVSLGSLERTVAATGSDNNRPWSKYDVYLGNFGSATDASTGVVRIQST